MIDYATAADRRVGDKSDVYEAAGGLLNSCPDAFCTERRARSIGISYFPAQQGEAEGDFMLDRILKSLLYCSILVAATGTGCLPLLSSSPSLNIAVLLDQHKAVDLSTVPAVRLR